MWKPAQVGSWQVIPIPVFLAADQCGWRSMHRPWSECLPVFASDVSSGCLSGGTRSELR